MSILDRLRDDLKTALRARNKTEVSMIRTLVAAIENAEAIEPDPATEPKIGLNHDQPRRELTPGDIEEIIRGERAEVAEAAEKYRELGLTERAADLAERIAIVDRYLP